MSESLPGCSVTCLVASALLAAAPSATAQENGIAARDARVSLAWGDCPFDRSEIEEEEGLRIRCGELSVPEDWKSEEDRTLGIAFTVAEPEGAATGEPVVLMPGGPGMTVVPRGLRLLRRWGVGDRTLVVGILDDPERRPDGSCLGELEPRRLISAGSSAERPGSTRALVKTSTSSAPGSTILYSGTPWRR